MILKHADRHEDDLAELDAMLKRDITPRQRSAIDQWQPRYSNWLIAKSDLTEITARLGEQAAEAPSHRE